MAEFCTPCANDNGFPVVDIDLKKIFESLEEGYYTEMLCEGCGLVALLKRDGKNHSVTITMT